MSRFFKTGPKKTRSPHAVGSGPLPSSHNPTRLAPAVGAGNDASAHQAHGRNDVIYQAPFLPPPIFSGAKFTYYAFFAKDQVPVDVVTITAQSPEGPIELSVPVTKIESVGRTVHLLAAKTLIKDLEDGTSHLHYRYTSVPASKRSNVKNTGFFGRFRSQKVGGAGQDKACLLYTSPSPRDRG